MYKQKRTETRTILLEIGLELFSRRGYNGTGIKEIVDAAKVPKGSFYNYFKSKEVFADEVIRHYADTLAIRWSGYLDEGPQTPLEALRYCFERMIVDYEKSEIKSGCLIGNLAAEISESSELCKNTLQQVVLSWQEHIACSLEEAQKSGFVRTDISAEMLTDFFWSAWEGALLRMKIDNSTTPVRACIAVMFDHICRPHVHP
ncbi:MAG: TetR/AcrR family transcriptional regulator [Burkholderiales bacterium]|nr:TetR/AcrR family transcriptional regulator [Burkholderiales bacterium]